MELRNRDGGGWSVECPADGAWCFDETGFDVTAPGDDWHIEIEGDGAGLHFGSAGEMRLTHAGFEYSVRMGAGVLVRGQDRKLYVRPGPAGIRINTVQPAAPV
jgi:hypothetical protein